ncbi:M23 family metallopeptidase [Nocardioides alcanivorans]|uniref:M23 family metallopeptidase n=1 Tax=Nocardioides alcanivorans TaxID=2897352 RepID=UPI001F2D3A4A|nr:M23 family metallopeptidase [Nocardioides alcanivorans]
MARLFPSERRHRTVALFAAILTVLGVALAPLAFADDLKDKQREVKKELEHAHDDLEHSSAALRRATKHLERSQAQLAAARSKLASTRGKLDTARVLDQKMQAELVQAEADLTQAVADLKSGRQDVRDQQGNVDRMFADAYEAGDPTMEGFAALLNAEDLGDVARVQAATRDSLQEQDTQLAELEAAEVLLGVRRDEVKEQRDDVKVRRQEAAANLELMKKLEAQAAAEKASVAELVSDSRDATRRAEKVRARDAKTLRALEADQKRIERMLRERARKQNGNTSRTTANNSGGFLSYPVKGGYVTSSYGMRTHPIYGYRSLHDGTDFGTGGCGAPLLATADGTVISEYFQTAWGNRLILDHGNVKGVGLASIYNHASNYTVSVGQKVKRGQVIGYVGTTGWSTGCHLHFTVMVNGSPVNPMNWL